MSAGSLGARLDALDALRGEAGPDGADVDAYMLGALIVGVSDADWHDAIATTLSCMADAAKARAEIGRSAGDLVLGGIGPGALQAVTR